MWFIITDILYNIFLSLNILFIIYRKEKNLIIFQKAKIHFCIQF